MTRPGNGPYIGTFSDGMYHFTVAISKEMHASIAALLVTSDMNRTAWVREAIAEKIARDTGNDGESGETIDKQMTVDIEKREKRE